MNTLKKNSESGILKQQEGFDKSQKMVMLFKI